MSSTIQCPNCGNTDFEDENGLLVCTSCGRQQEGPLLTEQDDADFGTQGKIVRKKVEKSKIKVTTIYRGPKAYRLYLLAWQHIMWRQTHALIHGSAKAPSQIWTVARDLWTVWLSRLSRQAPSTGDRTTTVADRDQTTEISESEVEKASIKERTGFSPKLWDTIALVYLAALLVQAPVTLCQLYQAIRTEELPFIRAIRYVPIEMASKLPPEYGEALDTTTIPQAHDLQTAVYRNLQRYRQSFGFEFPPINWHIVLFRWLEQLALPPEVYAAVKRLNKIIGYDFAYRLDNKQKDLPHAAEATRTRRSAVSMAEVQLMALVIMITKLLFPSDTTAVGHAELRLDWAAWLKIHKSLGISSTEQGSPSKHIETKDRDVMKFDPEQMDSYMDWYQRTFSNSDASFASRNSDLEKSIVDMFPLLNSQDKSATDSDMDTVIKEQKDGVMRITSEAILPALVHDDDEADSLQVAGSMYAVYQSVEALKASVSNEEDTNAQKAIVYLHEQAAELACTDVKQLLRAVRHTEMKIMAWQTDQKRKEVFGVSEP